MSKQVLLAALAALGMSLLMIAVLARYQLGPATTVLRLQGVWRLDRWTGNTCILAVPAPGQEFDANSRAAWRICDSTQEREYKI